MVGKSQRACSIYIHFLFFLRRVKKTNTQYRRSARVLAFFVIDYESKKSIEKSIIKRIKNLSHSMTTLYNLIRRKVNLVLFDIGVKLLIFLEQQMISKNCVIRKRKHNDAFPFCYSEINVDKYCNIVVWFFFSSLIIFFRCQSGTKHVYEKR
jgi:hypothetical protein